MDKGTRREPEVERVEFAGHVIECRALGDREELRIDGNSIRVLRSDNGYNVYDDAYVPPHLTLMEAAKAYVEKLSKDK